MAERPDPNADPIEGIGFNMTPMIDVVFQLIIFLMLANDMSRKEIEDLLLPDAVHATENLQPVDTLTAITPSPVRGWLRS